jgi:dolichyl-phosphate-mannose-protein mannosyltransferase
MTFPSSFTQFTQFTQRFARRRHWSNAVQLGAIILAGLLIRIAFIQAAGYHDDVVIFANWFTAIAAAPLAHVYAQVPGLNYPPMIVVMYKLEAIVVHWFVHGNPNEYVLNITIKLPPILLDCVGAALVYRVVRHYAAHRFALLGAAFIALNPAIIYDSAFWGQNDVIPTLLALFAISELLVGNAIVAWLSIAAAVLFKPPVLVLVPLMLLHPFRVTGAQRRARLFWGALGVAGALAMAEVFAYVFFEHPNPVAALRHLVAQYMYFSSVFPYLSLSAFNIWALFAPFFTSDATKVLGVALHTWGNVLFILAAAAISWRSLRARRPRDVFEACALVLLAFFVLMTEMHERYLYYAVVFFAPLVSVKRYRNAALILTLTLVLNLEYGLTFMYLDDAQATVVNRFEFAPWLVHVCAVANIATLGVLGWKYLFARPAPAMLVAPTTWPAIETSNPMGARVEAV